MNKQILGVLFFIFWQVLVADLRFTNSVGAFRYDNDSKPGQYSETILQYAFSGQVSLLGGYRNNDYQVANDRLGQLGMIYNFQQGTVLDCRYLREQNNEFYDGYGYALEVSQTVLKGLDLLAGYKNIAYHYNNVQVGTLGFIHYFSDYTYLVTKYFGSIDAQAVRSGVYWLEYVYGFDQHWQGILGGTSGTGYDSAAELAKGQINTYHSRYVGVRYYFMPLKSSLKFTSETSVKQDFYTKWTHMLALDIVF